MLIRPRVLFTAVLTATLIQGCAVDSAMPDGEGVEEAESAATSGWPTIPRQHVLTATKIRLHQFTDDGQGRVGGASSWGVAPEILAYASFTGDTTADARLLEQSDSALSSESGVVPLARTPSQFENRVAVMWAVMRRTPRIWDRLSAAKQGQITSAMKAMLFSAAFVASDGNPRTSEGELSLYGVRGITRSYGTNISFGATIAKILATMSFFGSPAAVDALLDDFDMSDFRAELASRFGRNHRLYESFNWRNEGHTGVDAIRGRSTDAPTDAEVERALRQWRYYGTSILSVRDLLLHDRSMGKALGQKVQSGLNDGAGATGDPNRGKILSGASKTPWLNTEDAMFYELNGRDAEGERSSMGYGTWTARLMMDAMLSLEIARLLPKNDPQIANMLVRLAKAFDVWRYFSRRGYASYAHGGDKGGGGGSPATWPPGGPSDWYVPMNESLWFDVLRVRLGLPTAVP